MGLVPWGRGGLQLGMMAAGAVLNLVVTAVAVPLYGPWGAVAAIFSSEILGLVLGIAIRYRLRLFWHPLLPAVLPPLVCSAAAAAVLVVLPRSLDSCGGCSSSPRHWCSACAYYRWSARPYSRPGGPFGHAELIAASGSRRAWRPVSPMATAHDFVLR